MPETLERTTLPHNFQTEDNSNQGVDFETPSFITGHNITSTVNLRKVRVHKQHASVKWLTFSDEGEITPSFVKLESKVDNIKELFHKEFYSCYCYIGDNVIPAFYKTEELIDAISSIEYKNISLELTPDKAIIFDIELRNGNTLYIKHNYSPVDQSKDTYFSVFHKHECIFNGIGSFSDVITDVNNLLKKA